MSQRDGMRVEQALGRLGPLAILGSAFLLGGLLGGCTGQYDRAARGGSAVRLSAGLSDRWAGR